MFYPHDLTQGYNDVLVLVCKSVCFPVKLSLAGKPHPQLQGKFREGEVILLEAFLLKYKVIKKLTLVNKRLNLFIKFGL